MPAIANMSLADGAAVPVTHVFEAITAGIEVKADGTLVAKSYWKDFDAATDVGRKTLQLVQTIPPSSRANGFIDSKATMVIPKVNTVGVSDAGITPALTRAYHNQYQYWQRISVRAPAADVCSEPKLFINAVAQMGTSAAGVGTAPLTNHKPYN